MSETTSKWSARTHTRQWFDHPDHLDHPFKLNRNKRCGQGKNKGLNREYIGLLEQGGQCGRKLATPYPTCFTADHPHGRNDRHTWSELGKLKSEYANGIAAMNNQYYQQVNQENQARQAEDMQRRAIAAQYLMNMQNINAAQQMNNRPVTTNCNRFGNQVNCTTN